MNEQSAWARAAAAEGTTASERALGRLARKAFLSLWSYSNVYTDESRRNGKGDGKELCDLLVVFGDTVLLFSDKACEYHQGTDVRVAWPRWYKRAIEKSAHQLAGAEKFARAFPERIFLDKGCQTPLPVKLPSRTEGKYYLIAVTRGAHQAARTFFGGGSSGSVMLLTTLRGRDHYDAPFRIGFPLESGRFIHVLDEMTVDLLLEELDTIPDLVSYLQCKEEFLLQPRCIFSIPGEEELLSRYMMTIRNGQHALPCIPKSIDFVSLPEGDWTTYAASPQRVAKRKADEISYLWDALIEHHSSFIRAGTARTLSGMPAGGVDHERVLRAFAEQNRLARRDLASDLHYVLTRNESPGSNFARVKLTGQPASRAFVFLASSPPVGVSYEEYRQARMDFLEVYCNAIKEKMPTLREAIGIASEPLSARDSSQDFLYVDHSTEMTLEEARHWRKAAEEFGILRPTSTAQAYKSRSHEFPVPFKFDYANSNLSPEGIPMNRADRRRMAKETRKKPKNQGR